MNIFSRLITKLVCVGSIALLLSTSNAEAVTLKIATSSPDGSPWMKLLRQAGKDVAAQSDGRVKFKFYPGSVMGDDKVVLRKIRVGQLHGAMLTVGVMSQVYPDLQIYGLPMVFNSTEELDHVRAKMDASLLAGLEANGYVAFGLAEIGFAYAMSRNAFSDVAGARAQKVWVPAGDIGSERALAAFDISPIPLSIGDVLGGLQTGLINAVAGPPVGAIALQWHTRLKEVLDLPLLYAYGLVMVSDKQFKKLSAADQRLVRDTMGDAIDAANARARHDNNRAAQALQVQGLNWNKPTIAEVAQWQAKADSANKKLVEEGVVSEKAWTELQGYLSEIR